MRTNHPLRFQTIVIGGGQAGLCAGYYLKKRGLPFVILDAQPHIGAAWRNRWDSLRLFSPSRYVLPGLPLPRGNDYFPTKDQIADYLVEYARRYDLPVRNGVCVDRLTKEGERFVLQSGGQRYESENVIVAMANYQRPRVPAFAPELDPAVIQMHSHHFRNSSQLKPGPVLIIGLGNSGADIAIELAKTHQVIVSGKESGHIPWPIEGFFARNVLMRLVRFVGHHVLSVHTPVGRKARPKLLHRTTSLIRVKPKDLVAAGVERVPKTAGVRDGLPLLADGRRLEVENVIWCTGYQHDFPWIDLPIFDELGDAMHEKGVVPTLPGLYFLGLHFLTAMSSATLMGVGRDARRIVKHLAARTRSLAAKSRPEGGGSKSHIQEVADELQQTA